MSKKTALVLTPTEDDADELLEDNDIHLNSSLVSSLAGAGEGSKRQFRRRRHAQGKRPEILVTNFDGEGAVRAAFRMWADGNFHSSKGLPDREPFSKMVLVTQTELGRYPDADEQERYGKKKRNLVLKVIHALSLVGILRIKLQTSGSVYILTDLGAKIIRGLALMDALDEANVSYDEAVQKLFPNRSTPLEVKE